MPSKPGSPHALQVPAHKRSQHTPSVQNPLSGAEREVGFKR